MMNKVKSLVICLILILTGVVQSITVNAESHHGANLKDDELAFMPTHILARKIRSGDIKASRIVGIYLDRIKKYNPTINAIVTFDESAARKRAQEADAALSKGVLWGPLHGVPITIKDNYGVKGMRSTAGYPPLKDNIPDEDATVVKRLQEAGAIILGKTNMPQLGLDGQTFNPIFGTTNNPWDLSRTPGGSSGGCSAAVAAGLTSFSIGNDIGGSIRVPAHFTGIYGIKPTEGFVPESGFVKEKNSFRSVRHLLTHGPLARSVEDLSLVMKIIAGADGIDAEVPRVVTEPETRKSLTELKIAWTDGFNDAYVSPESQDVLRSFVSKLKSGGVAVHKVTPATIDFDQSRKLFNKMLFAEISTEATWFERALLCFFSDICPAADLKSYLETLSERDRLISKMAIFLKDWDVWVVPVGSGTAFKHRVPDDFMGPFPVYEDPLLIGDDVDRTDYYTTLFNLTGHPSVVIPVGHSKEGLPIGAQLVGKKWYDMELLTVAEQLAKIGSAYQRPPGYE